MSSEKTLTHFNEEGNVHMVDVGEKQVTSRKAVAKGSITMEASTLSMIESGSHKKGDVLGISRIAGIMASKKTSGLIPLCHPIMLTNVMIDLEIDKATNAVHCYATTKTNERTGVEMEALIAVQVSLATIYDMCKAVDRGMEISSVHLVHKSGGKSGDWNRE